MSTEAKQSKAEAEAQKKGEELVLFCPCCFASSDGGSWTVGEAVVDYLCSNCGASGPNLKIPRWSVDSIRRQASWVGKRYYAHEEDKATYEELQDLRATIKEFPGRYVERTANDECYMISQDLPSGSRISTFTEASTPEKAMEEVKLNLPYIPASKLKKKPKK